MVIREKGL